MKVTPHQLLLVKRHEIAGLDSDAREILPLVLRSVAPKHSVRLAKRSDFLHPLLNMRITGYFTSRLAHKNDIVPFSVVTISSLLWKTSGKISLLSSRNRASASEDSNKILNYLMNRRDVNARHGIPDAAANAPPTIPPTWPGQRARRADQGYRPNFHSSWALRFVPITLAGPNASEIMTGFAR